MPIWRYVWCCSLIRFSRGRTFRVNLWIVFCCFSIFCRFQGHSLYGIRSVAAFADRLRTVVSDCARAARSSDARDKYFLSHVETFDPLPAKGLRSELPAMEAARASLAATVSELADATPQLSSCRREEFASMVARRNEGVGQRYRLSVNQSENEQKGYFREGLGSLLAEARSSIVSVRSVLA